MSVQLGKTATRGVLALCTALLAMPLLVGQAAAHVEVTAEPASPGATDATITFTVEGESSTAGIQAVQVRLPDQLAPADVTWSSGPAGWSLQPTADGYTTSGPAVATGEDARYSLKVRRLPDATTMVFKTLVTYTDGTIVRWIDLPGADGTEPEHPAPVVTLAAPVAQSVPAPSTAGGPPAVLWVGLAVLILAVAVVRGPAVAHRRAKVNTRG